MKLHGTACSISVPDTYICRWNLTSMVKKQINDAPLNQVHATSSATSITRCLQPRPGNQLELLAARMVAKIEEGDLKGAVRLAAYRTQSLNFVMTLLQHYNPLPHTNTSMPPPPDLNSDYVYVSVDEVTHVFKSFPNGLA